MIVVQVYTIYSILSIVFLILIIVTAFITVALTYFQLAVEDHRWWWRSFLNGGSTGAHPSSVNCRCGHCRQQAEAFHSVWLNWLIAALRQDVKTSA